MASGTIKTNNIIYDDYDFTFAVTANSKGYQSAQTITHSGYEIIGAVVVRQNFASTLITPFASTSTVICNYYSYGNGNESVKIRVAWAKV